MSHSRCLALERICFKYGKRPIFENFDLAVDAGEIIRIDGANGSGKTTLFHLIMGLLAPSKGRIIFAGKNITKMPVPRRARLGVSRVHQFSRLFGMESAETNIYAAMINGHRCERKMMDNWNYELPPGMNNLKINEVPAAELSYGWQRIVSFMQALVPRPRLLLLDEPFSGLADTMRHWMARIIMRSAEEERLGVLLIDHERRKDIEPHCVINIPNFPLNPSQKESS